MSSEDDQWLKRNHETREQRSGWKGRALKINKFNPVLRGNFSDNKQVGIKNDQIYYTNRSAAHLLLSMTTIVENRKTVKR